MKRIAILLAAMALLVGCGGVGDFLRGYGKARSSALAAYDTAAMTPDTIRAIERSRFMASARRFSPACRIWRPPARPPSATG